MRRLLAPHNLLLQRLSYLPLHSPPVPLLTAGPCKPRQPAPAALEAGRVPQALHEQGQKIQAREQEKMWGLSLSRWDVVEVVTGALPFDLEICL